MPVYKDKSLLTSRQAASIIGCDIWTLRRNPDRFPFVTLSNHPRAHRRYRIEDVRRWADEWKAIPNWARGRRGRGVELLQELQAQVDLILPRVLALRGMVSEALQSLARKP